MTSAFYLHWISPDQIIYEGDEQMMGLIALAAAGVFASLTLIMALLRPKKREEEEAAE